MLRIRSCLTFALATPKSQFAEYSSSASARLRASILNLRPPDSIPPDECPPNTSLLSRWPLAPTGKLLHRLPHVARFPTSRANTWRVRATVVVLRLFRTRPRETLFVPHGLSTRSLRSDAGTRHSAQTGSREIVTSGVPPMRQSEGNNTAKRLSAAQPPQRETIERPATALAWVARVRSPLLLKTASRVPVELAVHGRRISLQYNGDADR
jgi:hypothetical protein